MSTLSDPVVTYLEANGLPYWWEAADEVLAFPASSPQHSWTIYVTFLDDRHQVLVRSVRDDLVPASRVAEVGTFVTRANFGLVIGNFELDLDDGELRFKTSIDVENDRLTEGLVEHLVLANVASFSRYLPGVDAVIDGADPAAAVARIEQQ